jgi:hypothetical protein
MPSGPVSGRPGQLGGSAFDGSSVNRRPRLPGSDTLVHLGVWAAATILVGRALWSWGGL